MDNSLYCLLMEEILPRLPVKSLIRFKSVSRNWYVTISSPVFSKLHSRFFASCKQPRILAITDMTEEEEEGERRRTFYSLNCSDDDEGMKVERLVLDDEREFAKLFGFRVVGCCNGLVCLYFQGKSSFMRIWNPATREYRDITKPASINDYDLFGSIGFGYVDAIDDYKIVSLLKMNGKDFDVNVYSLKASEWKRITCLMRCRMPLGMEPWIGVGDSVFWFVRELCDWHNISNILSFNLVSHEFEEIRWLDSRLINDSGYNCFKLCKMNNSLSVCCWNRLGVGFDILTLKNGDSWEKVFSQGGRISFKTVFNTGKCLVQYSHWQDMKRKNREEEKKCTMITEIHPLDDPKSNTAVVDFPQQIVAAWDYVETLVSPLGQNQSSSQEIKQKYFESNDLKPRLTAAQKLFISFKAKKKNKKKKLEAVSRLSTCSWGARSRRSHTSSKFHADS